MIDCLKLQIIFNFSSVARNHASKIEVRRLNKGEQLSFFLFEKQV